MAAGGHDRSARLISAGRARRLIIQSQGLDGRWRLPPGAEGAAQVVERLGYVQIDTIAVVQRAHEHVLWSRYPDYDPKMLHQLQAVDRRVFEYWTHAASYVPMADYRFYLPRMRGFADGERMRSWRRDNARLARQVLERIREEGGLAASEFEAPPDKRGPWWDWKPAKRALEYLYSSGELMISDRRKFQRVYDLAERVLPPEVDTSLPSADDRAHFSVRRALGNLGVSGAGDMRWWLRDPEAVSAALAELVEVGEVTPVRVRGWDGEAQYALTEALEASSRGSRRRRRLHILSPFDNLVIRRRRLKQIFDFDYKLEAYVPAPKRQYGYFCLALLWGDRFIGRIDPKAERRQKRLVIRSLILEPGTEIDDELMAGLAGSLSAFAAFNGCERTEIEHSRPARVGSRLQRLIEAK